MIQVKKSTIASTTIIPTIHYKCSPQLPSGSSRSKGGPSKSTISRNKQKEKKELNNQILVQAVKDRYETIAISVHHSRHQDPQDLKGSFKSTISRNERKN
ncbi:unnamed protein product [Rhizophagus irregularis]|uniref:Uncharacterized protein n=1 Tax=Rhizophagus irregularis TaxID=588596 RepID=A0A915YZF5_9GLOM|nr:unnamed protein product [Rhizophagus irregularis]